MAKWQNIFDWTKRLNIKQCEISTGRMIVCPRRASRVAFEFRTSGNRENAFHALRGKRIARSKGLMNCGNVACRWPARQDNANKTRNSGSWIITGNNGSSFRGNASTGSGFSPLITRKSNTKRASNKQATRIRASNILQTDACARACSSV